MSAESLPSRVLLAYGDVMPHRIALADLLNERRHRSSPSRALYDDLVATLRRTGVGARVPMIGDTFPPFALPDHVGRYRSLAELLGGGPLVLTFIRGGWCPYCALELRAWRAALPELAAAGGRLAIVTPEVGGRAALMARQVGFGADATLLCDVDLGVALTCGLAFSLGEPMLRRYREGGIDLASLYGSAGGLLPVPATIVIDVARVVRFAFADPDFRLRAEPADVIEAVRAITGQVAAG